MGTNKLSLHTVSPEALRTAWEFFNELPARTRVSEEHVTDEQLRVALADFLGQPAWILAGLLEAVLSERGRIEIKPASPGVAAQRSAVLID